MHAINVEDSGRIKPRGGLDGTASYEAMNPQITLHLFNETVQRLDMNPMSVHGRTGFMIHVLLASIFTKEKITVLRRFHVPQYLMIAASTVYIALGILLTGVGGKKSFLRKKCFYCLSCLQMACLIRHKSLITEHGMDGGLFQGSF